MSPKIVQDVLGHADVTLTLNTYSHVIGSTAHEQMAKIDGLFKPSVLEQLEENKQKVKDTQEKKVKRNEQER